MRLGGIDLISGNRCLITLVVPFGRDGAVSIDGKTQLSINITHNQHRPLRGQPRIERGFSRDTKRFIEFQGFHG